MYPKEPQEIKPAHLEIHDKNYCLKTSEKTQL